MSGRDREESLLARWARRKAEAARGRAEEEQRPAREVPPPRPESVPAAGTGPEPAARAEHAEAGDDREPEDPRAELERLGLPDPDTLGPEANFRAFFAEGVPAWLKRRAMRRLFRVNPIIRTVDMMDDYAEDFTDAATVTALLKSAGDAARRLQQRLARDADTGTAVAPAGEAAPPPEEAAARGGGREGAETADATPREPDEGAEKNGPDL